MSLKVEENGGLTVRAPYGVKTEVIDEFVEAHGDWICTRRQEYERIRRLRPSYTEKERQEGKQRAAQLLREKCQYFAAHMGVTYGTVTVREQRTRWGSCSARGNLSFNWKLATMPEEIVDYLVVHELAHRIEMNHSPAFWAIVEKQIPDYKERRAWLKQNGAFY